MYTLQNGILLHDGNPVFMLGQSYYPSYHPQKIPVLAEGDREGEMRKDLRAMAEAGFNMVRMAALGEITRDSEGEVRVSFPFIDSMVAYAQEVELSSMVRLQGYGTNLCGYTDATMRNQNDDEMPFEWGWFVRNCLNHDGILRDDEDACVASARHFRNFPSLVSFQIYNEPAYPSQDFYDYNPHSLTAWRRWLVERGLRSETEVAGLDAPRCRPHYNEDPADWINWRLFHYERLNWYLNHLSEKAKAGYPLPETLTCHMPCPLMPGAAVRGEDYFRVAEKMDIMGITHYIPSVGVQHYVSSAVIDLAESAAAVFGKHAWIVEYNGRTDLSANEWERETYSAIGSGVTGIMYYEWRADYPFPDAPEPEAFGMVYNDGRKTVKYDRAVAMNRLIGRIGERFVRAGKVRSGVAVLFSEYANAWHDAHDNGLAHLPGERFNHFEDRNVLYSLQAYQDLRRAGVSVDFVRAIDLADNPLQTRLLVVPSREGLCKDELARLEQFEQAGGMVYDYGHWNGGFQNSKSGKHPLETRTLLERAGIALLFTTDAPHLDVKFLQEGSACIACLINTDTEEREIPAGKHLQTILCPKATTADFYAPGRRETLAVRSNHSNIIIDLPQITTGGFILLHAHEQ